MSGLTERQQQCLLLTATMTDKEIARELGLSPHTVNMHIRNAMEKLGATSRRGALRAITGNTLGGIPAMGIESEINPTRAVLDPVDQNRAPASLDLHRGWLFLPASMPSPPIGMLKRLLVIFAIAFSILVAGASLIGLFGMVADNLNRWAVDPNNP